MLPTLSAFAEPPVPPAPPPPPSDTAPLTIAAGATLSEPAQPPSPPPPPIDCATMPDEKSPRVRMLLTFGRCSRSGRARVPPLPPPPPEPPTETPMLTGPNEAETVPAKPPLPPPPPIDCATMPEEFAPSVTVVQPDP